MSLSGLLLCATACSSPAIRDYEAFYNETPYTIAVLPVENETADANAPRYFLSTIGKPLIDRGYYVLPVQMTSEILAAEGLGEGGALKGVAPHKFKEYFGADAILRITLKAWDTTYLIIASSVTVAMHYELVSTGNGQTLWQTDHKQTISSGSSGSGLAALFSAVISAAVTAAASDYVPMAQKVNIAACTTLPPGPYDSGFAAARTLHLKEAREAREKAAKSAKE